MLNPKFNKPEIIANGKFQFQIVDTPKSVKTRTSISFAGYDPQFNRTLVELNIKTLNLYSEGHYSIYIKYVASY
ncbi:hypothetical protein S2091_0388 [Solimicrobium silvestre]|uniref:Uncharacterized protein n=1 Tax=Solimicrobium silvestre TaxID=2099400 RepID=A0A2S9H5I7_9BURK|nr:hypothetical protein S2091_0388 [Solimicrobium silvestre]